MNGADQQQPEATGDLGRTPFAHLLLYLYRQGLSGTLVIARAGFETKILFRAGKAVAARPLPRGAGLQDGLLELCDLAEASYAFWANDLLTDTPGITKGTVDPFTFAGEALRSGTRTQVIASVVDRYRDVRLTLVADADLKRLGMRGPDVRKAERFRDAVMTIEEFAAQAELPLEDARKLVYLLIVTGMCAPEHGATARSGVRSAVSSVPPAPVAEPSRSPAAPASLPPVAQRLASPRPPAVTPRAFPAASSSSMPAWQQLASMRAAARSSNPPAGPPHVPSNAPLPVELLDDAGKLKRAEQLLESHHHADATRIADELLRRYPSNASYHALRAYALCQTFTGTAVPSPLLDAIDAALRLDPQQPRALYVRGVVLKRLGKERDALRWFQRALEADPNHIDAQRELRLAKLRRDK